MNCLLQSCRLLLALVIALSTCGSAKANMQIRPDHDWTVHYGREGVGLVGYDRQPPFTDIRYGFGSFTVRMSIYKVTAIGAVLIGSIMGLGIYAFNHRDKNS